MKSNLKFILPLFALGFISVFLSCKKDEIKSTEPEVQLRANETPLNQLVLNPEDKADEHINIENVKLATVLKKIITDEEINKFIVETAQKNKGEVMYEQLFEAFPQIKALYNNTVLGQRNIIASVSQGDDKYDFIRNDIAYNAMLYIPNFEVCRPSKKGIVSPEVQIYKEIGEGDIYFAWDMRGGNGKDSVEVFITEKEAMRLNVPVVMTSLKHMAFLKPYTPKLRKPNEATYSFTPIEKDGLKERGNWDESIWVRRANILYNYDGGTTAELCVIGGFISDDGQTVAWARQPENKQWFNVSNHNSTCSLVGTNDDNKFTLLGYYNTTLTNIYWRDKKYFFNAWERDWGSSNKPLGNADYAGRTLNFSGARKYTDEWYIYHPQRTLNFLDALPMNTLFNNPGQQAFPLPDPDPNDPNFNDCPSFSPSKFIGIKADIAFTRGWF